MVKTSNTGDKGSIPGQGTQITTCLMVWPKKKKKRQTPQKNWVGFVLPVSTLFKEWKNPVLKAWITFNFA